MSKGSHPPTLLTLAKRLIKREQLLPAGAIVLCACSGGPDSSALLHVLALLREDFGHTLLACGIDHGLREAATTELAAAAALAERLDVPFSIKRLALAAGGNLQERAREARHASLQEHARQHGVSHVALGHTADDRAETVLLRLLRGSGPRGLAAMPARAKAVSVKPPDAGVPLIRPILLARRSDVLSHADRHGISIADDPSNRDPRFLRSRVRHELLPLMHELSPRITEHLCALAEMQAATLGEDDAVLHGLGRAQRMELGRFLAKKRGALNLRLAGGHQLEMQFLSSSPVPEDKT